MDTRRLLALVKLLCKLSLYFLACVASHGASAETSRPSCIWFGDDSSIYQARAGDGTTLRSVTLPATSSIAMDGDCSAYAIAAKRLSRLDASGGIIVERALTSIDAGLANPGQLIADPYDNSAWVAGTKVIVHVAATGEGLATMPTPAPLRAFALGQDRSLWVLGNKVLWHIGSGGDLLATRRLETVNEEPKLLAVDSLGDVLWLAGEKRLTRVSLADDNSVPGSIPLPETATALAVNPQNGELWLIAGDQLLEFARDGSALRAIDLRAAGVAAVTSAAFDPVTQSLWLTASDGLVKFSDTGKLLERVPTRVRPATLAVPAFVLAPTLELVRPVAGSVTNRPQPTIAYHVDATCNAQPCAPPVTEFARIQLSATLNGEPVTPFVPDAELGLVQHTPAQRLPEGLNRLVAHATDRFGHRSRTAADSFTLDTIPPAFLSLAPVSGTVMTTPQVTIEGVLDDPDASVVLDGSAITPAVHASNATLAFSFMVALHPGQNTFTVSAVDKAGNVSSRTLLLTFTPPPPPTPVAADITAGKVINGGVTVTGTAGAVAPGTQVVVTNGRTAQQAVGTADPSGAFSVAIAAATGDVLSIQARNAWGVSSAAISVTLASAKPSDPNAVEGIVPPDPASLAPPNAGSVPTRLAASVAFLYSGANPIQTGVAAGTIEDRRITVIRGRVSDRDGHAMPAVRVRVLNHPEFGQTFTRADGQYDLAANGGAVLTLTFDKRDMLPAQSQVSTPWRNYVTAPDVSLIELDDHTTTVDLTSSQRIQAALGSVVSDADGVRQVAALFPAGTTARMHMLDGTDVALPSITFRATEYTVGPNGPAVMPGRLPSMTGYTYAVELSADEAIAAGASTVTFSKPVPVYVDNFLDFPVGTVMPVGYYDRAKGAWVPSLNGRIIKVLSVTAGLADLDIVGDGKAADATQLASLGISADERQQIAQMYQPGKSVTRFAVTHFTPYDVNLPIGPPPGATGPSGCDKDGHCAEVEHERDDTPSQECGSIIECENQVLGETIPLTGTTLSLNYRSNRSAAYRPTRRMRVPISAAALPSTLLRIETTVSIAGRDFQQVLAPTPNQTLEFEWDGKDVYGRDVLGRTPVSVTIAYVYKGIYYAAAADIPFSFNTASGVVLMGDRRRVEARLERRITGLLSAESGIGPNSVAGWTLDVQHIYDPNGNAFLYGDGTTRHGKAVNITSIAPNSSANALVIDDAGTVYSTGGGARKFSMDGTISRIFASDTTLTTLAGDSNGNLYYSTFLFNRTTLMRMAPDGTRTIIAGDGIGVPADQLKPMRPLALAVDRDGSIYFSENTAIQGSVLVERCRVRKLGTDGSISTVAGTGSCYGSVAGDGGPAVAATLVSPGSLAVDSQGNLYIADSQVVRRVSPDGLITTVAGTTNPAAGCVAEQASQDGIPATQFCLGFVRSIAVDRNDHLLVASDLYMNSLAHYRSAVVRVNDDGTVTTVAASNGAGCTSTDPAMTTVSPARAICSDNRFTAIAVNADNDVVASHGANVVYIGAKQTRCVSAQGVMALSCEGAVAGANEKVFASEDGAQLYVIDQAGRHARTLNARTKALLHAFDYDMEGRLVAVTDGDGNRTTIERDDQGAPTAVVGPYGQRTQLAVDQGGHLTSVTNPAGETYRMSYQGAGLLTRFEWPRGSASEFSYDDLGRLTRDQNAVGGFWSLARSTGGSGGAYRVDMSTAMGRTKTHYTEDHDNGDKLRVETNPDATQSRTLVAGNTTTQTAPDGTVITAVLGADPRFGMQAAFPASVSAKLPSGLTYLSTTQRSVTLNAANDPYSLLSEVETTTINGNVFRTTYDALQRQVTLTSPLKRISVATSDEQGRPLMSQSGTLLPKRYAYDARGRLVSVRQGSGDGERVSSLAYNALGYVESVTDPLDRTTRYSYDAAGRVSAVTNPDGRVVAYRYDSNGNLVAITPPGRPQHGFDYDAVDQSTSYAPPALDGAGASTRYEYNLDKQLLKVLRPDGSASSYAYDSGGRLSQVNTATGSIDYSYSDTTGQLAGLVSGDVRLSFEYDGALPTSVRADGPVSGTVTAAYDEFFRVKRLGVNGAGVDYAYDKDGLLVGAGALVLSRDAANGQVSGATLGAVATTYGHDGFGQVSAMSNTTSAGELYAEEYVRDKGRRLVQKALRIQGEAHVYGYEYDVAGHLVHVTRDGADAGSFAYDENGNRTQAYGLAASYDDQDRLLQLGDAQYSYTPNGELSSLRVGGNTTRYFYDGVGILNRVELPGGTRIDYVIDAMNRRIGRKVNGVLTQAFLYQDQVRPAAELDGNGAMRARFIYASHPNVPDYMVKAGVTYRLLLDSLGSVRLVVDANTGAVAQRIDYDEWGNVQYDSNPGFQPFAYAGGLYDRDTGLLRFGARDYDPRTARWTSKDPIGFAGGSTSLYAYVEGNPVSFTDPLGLRPLTGPEKQILAPYIPQRDLDNADVHVGEMPGYAPDWAAGITRGNDIYIRDPNQTFVTPEDFGLLGHELVHVGQYADGMTWLSYLWANRNGYDNNPYEKDAYRIGDQIRKELRDKYGATCPVK